MCWKPSVKEKNHPGWRSCTISNLCITMLPVEMTWDLVYSQETKHLSSERHALSFCVFMISCGFDEGFVLTLCWLWSSVHSYSPILFGFLCFWFLQFRAEFWIILGSVVPFCDSFLFLQSFLCGCVSMTSIVMTYTKLNFLYWDCP